jgi:ribose 5-phosphate isomerase A
MTIAEVALTMIQDGMVIGLGTGRAAVAFIEALGPRVQAGLKIRGVPTSQSSAELAKKLGIPLTTLEDVASLDIDFDGSDEVDPQLQLIKGLGGALVREKIVAAASKRFVVLVGAEKLVPKLGANPHKPSVLPVEVVPYGLPLVRRKLEALGQPPVLRNKDAKPFVSDNGNFILDCQLRPIADPISLEQQIKAIPGVVDTGLFLNMADVVLVQDGDKVQVRERGK